ncbi:hypothetical protein JNM87_04635 [Candidatus Saccharibacteria bacterium]|nr:hypothetical protein [Candidatus Saccharibacteria bacterium]
MLRTLYDGGARVTPDGRLVLTADQVETARHEMDTEITSIDASRLLVNIDELATNDTQMLKACSALKRAGAGNVMDILVLGRRWAGEVRNIGEASLGLLQGRLAELLPGVEWQENPIIEYAHIITGGDLGSVTSLAIGFSRRIEIDGSVRFTMLDGVPTPTVGQLTGMSVDDIKGLFTAGQPYDEHNVSHHQELLLMAQHIKQAANSYASSFRAVRT